MLKRLYNRIAFNEKYIFEKYCKLYGGYFGDPQISYSNIEYFKLEDEIRNQYENKIISQRKLNSEKIYLKNQIGLKDIDKYDSLNYTIGLATIGVVGISSIKEIAESPVMSKVLITYMIVIGIGILLGIRKHNNTVTKTNFYNMCFDCLESMEKETLFEFS